MYATVASVSVVGLTAHPVQVEVDIAEGLPMFTIVGLPDTTVQESRERVKSAIRNAGFRFPSHRITVNLAPADLRKEGAFFDLPVAIGILKASGQMDACLDGYVFLGELSLEGTLRASTAFFQPLLVWRLWTGLTRTSCRGRIPGSWLCSKGRASCHQRASVMSYRLSWRAQ